MRWRSRSASRRTILRPRSSTSPWERKAARARAGAEQFGQRGGEPRRGGQDLFEGLPVDGVRDGVLHSLGTGGAGPPVEGGEVAGGLPRTPPPLPTPPPSSRTPNSPTR